VAGDGIDSVAWLGLTWYDTARHVYDTAQHGWAWCGIEWHGMAWCGMVDMVLVAPVPDSG
jgi:hypothetical protein